MSNITRKERTTISLQTKQTGYRMMQMLKSGCFRRQAPGNPDPVRPGALEEQELENYRKFLKTRNACNLERLMGRENADEFGSEHL